jgi:hypothetical protein
MVRIRPGVEPEMHDAGIAKNIQYAQAEPITQIKD